MSVTTAPSSVESGFFKLANKGLGWFKNHKKEVYYMLALVVVAARPDPALVLTRLHGLWHIVFGSISHTGDFIVIVLTILVTWLLYESRQSSKRKPS